MTETKYYYKCGICGRKEEKNSNKPAPVCCEKIMVIDPLDSCTIAEHPEMVRNSGNSEPCDDGRGKESLGK